jgi:nicotinamidase-related amidase
MIDEPVLDPARTALLIMDYQVGLLHRLPDAQALLKRVNARISTLILAGISTSGVALSTVREAMDRDYGSSSSKTPLPTPIRTLTPSSPTRSFRVPRAWSPSTS